MDYQNNSFNFSPTPPQNDFQELGASSQPPVLMLAEQLQSAIGFYVSCDFLIGTQLLETRAGILNKVGTNFLTIYQPNLDRYIVCDLYALKFITIYNQTEIPR